MTKTLIILIIYFSLFSLADAKTIVAQGRAVIKDNNVAQAKAEAHQDALRQVALSTGVQVYSNTAIDTRGTMTDSLQLRSSQMIDSSEVIKESIVGDIITITVEAEISSSNDACDFPAANYRKKIAAVIFPLLHPEHLGITDYYNFDQGIPSNILHRLSLSDNFLTHEAHDLSIYEDLRQAPYISYDSSTGETLLSQIAYDRDVQYIISGVIRDLSIGLKDDRNEYLPDYVPSLSSWWGNQRKADKRNLIIDFFIHDALTGELLSKNSYSHSISDYTVIPEMATAFGTQAFFNSPFGQLFDQVLARESASIQKLLSCRPFTMRVIDEKDGKLYLNAGSSNRVRAGDVLTVYIPDKPGEIFGVKGASDQFGTPKTTIKIDKVYPAYSTAIPDSGYFSKQDIINGYLIAW